MKKGKLKRIVLITLIFSLITTGVIFSIRAVQMINWKNNPSNLPQDFTITAHTGCDKTPDNSLESIQYGIDIGADVVEIDLRFDGIVPVLAHDEKHINGAVRFDEAMELVAQSITLQVNIDVKDDAYLEEINSVVENYELLERVFFTGVSMESIPLIQEKCPLIPFYINCAFTRKQRKDRTYLTDFANQVTEIGALGINFSYKNLSKEIIEVFQDANLFVSVWTVDSNYDLLKTLNLAPNNITTRRPDRLIKILKDY